ncbi:hypothetical protein [Aquimarina sp. 2201CG14-23]|uniref:hypothetical protein n=1 Tax=Aquimarina mycalae TaxID=3040073 RepID=UPI0024780546|nr:hypothetical protein [Aquimarina sp. 2201CG14-23]MDH7447063.1 hypothetical protein [Aquimarina sp. 2201CG14-23]
MLIRHFIAFVIFPLYIFPQSKGHSIDTVKSSQLYKQLKNRQFDVSEDGKEFYHDIIKQSKAIKYQKGQLVAYENLSYYYASKNNIDSSLYYIQLFENAPDSDAKKDLSVMHYSNASITYEYNFGLKEAAYEAFLNIEQYVDKNDINKLTLWEIRKSRLLLNNNKNIEGLAILESRLKDTSDIKNTVKSNLFHSIGIAYSRSKKYDLSTAYMNKSIKIAQKEGLDDYNIYGDKIIIINNLLHQKKYQKALSLLLQLQKNATNIDRTTLDRNLATVLSKSYAGLKDYKTAKKYIEQAIANNSNYTMLPELYENLYEIYKSENNYSKMNETLLKKVAVQDSLHKKEKIYFSKYFNEKIKVAKHQKNEQKALIDVQALTILNNKQRQYISYLITALVLLIVSIVFFIKYKKTKKEIKFLKKNEKEILTNHIKVRETELLALMMDKSKKTEELSSIKTKLSVAIRKNDSSQLKSIEKSLNFFLRKSADDTLFSERLTSQYPGLTLILKNRHPELSPNDIRHCILVKLGLSLKESSNLLNVSISAIKSGRNRALKKMGLSEEKSLKEYLLEINDEVIAA